MPRASSPRVRSARRSRSFTAPSWGLLGVIGLGLVCATLAPAAPAYAADSAILHRGVFAEPESLEPRQSGVSSQRVIVRDLFEGLTTYGPDGGVLPGVATSWAISPDGQRYTFHLRPGLRWSDGSPLTAGDFVFTFRRALAPSTQAMLAHRLYILKGARAINEGHADPATLGVRAPDSATLVIDLEAPLPWLPLLLAGEEGMPLSQKAVERWGADWVQPGHYVSDGPFALAERRPRGYIRLVRNRYFHDAGNVKLDEVIYLPSDDVGTLVNRFRAGELDVNGWPGFPPERAADLRRELGGAVHVAALTSVRFLRFNLRHPPFDDPRVREALSLLVDRDVLTTRVLRGGEIPAYGIVPGGVDVAAEGKANELAAGTQASRVARAKALLEAAHFRERHPDPIRIALPQGNGTEVCIAVAAMWTSAGAPTRLDESEIKSMIVDLQRGNFEIALTGAQDVPAYEAYLERFETGASYNTGRYSSAAFDGLLAAARRVSDPAARAATLRRAEAVHTQDFVTVPLYQEVSRNLVSPRVRGWVDNPYDLHPSRFLGFAPP